MVASFLFLLQFQVAVAVTRLTAASELQAAKPPVLARLLTQQQQLLPRHLQQQLRVRVQVRALQYPGPEVNVITVRLRAQHHPRHIRHLLPPPWAALYQVRYSQPLIFNVWCLEQSVELFIHGDQNVP